MYRNHHPLHLLLLSDSVSGLWVLGTGEPLEFNDHRLLFFFVFLSRVTTLYQNFKCGVVGHELR